jgi:C4-dicarboxylate-specific signal transduction histidine kinase
MDAGRPHEETLNRTIAPSRLVAGVAAACFGVLVTAAGVGDLWARRTILAEGEARATATAAARAAVVATTVHDLLSDISDLSDLAGLATQLQASGDAAGAATARAMAERMLRALRLHLTGIDVIDGQGRTMLALGTPIAAPARTGLGAATVLRRHPGPNGEALVTFIRPLAVPGGAWARASFPLERLAGLLQSGLQGGFPNGARPMVGLADRLNGQTILRTEQGTHTLAPEPRVSQVTQEVMRAQPRGSLRSSSLISGEQTLVAFEALPDYGLVASVVENRADAMAGSDAELRWVHLLFLLFGLAAAAVTLAVVALDMRQRGRAALDALAARSRAEAAARAELDRLMRGSPALLYLGRIDGAGQYHRIFATRNTETVTGWPEAEMDTPDHVWSHVFPEDAEIRHTNFQRAVRLGRSTVEFRYRHPDGRVIWLRNEVVCLGRDSDGCFEVAGTVTNVTRERELAATAEIQSRMATLGELATGLAHELTQPVTVIGMAAELAEELARHHAGSEALVQQIASVQAQAARAGEIIGHLRLYGHAEGGQLGAVDLRKAIDGAMLLTSSPLHRDGVEVRVEGDDGVPAVRARLVQVEQVLVNLLLNARDAMAARPTGARRIVIRLAAEAAEGQGAVRLEMRDTGPGIDEQVLPRLFDSFFTTKPPGQGTGLGLSICRTLMQGFGGEITAASGAEGAVFTLTFQRA